MQAGSTYDVYFKMDHLAMLPDAKYMGTQDGGNRGLIWYKFLVGGGELVLVNPTSIARLDLKPARKAAPPG